MFQWASKAKTLATEVKQNEEAWQRHSIKCQSTEQWCSRHVQRAKTTHMLITIQSYYPPLSPSFLLSLPISFTHTVFFWILFSEKLNIWREEPVCLSDAKQRLSENVIFFLLSFSLADCVMLTVIGPSLRGSNLSPELASHQHQIQGLEESLFSKFKRKYTVFLISQMLDNTQFESKHHCGLFIYNINTLSCKQVWTQAVCLPGVEDNRQQQVLQRVPFIYCPPPWLTHLLHTQIHKHMDAHMQIDIDVLVKQAKKIWKMFH